MAENGTALAKARAPAVPMVGGALVPKDFEGMWRLAALFHRGGMLPHGVQSPEQVCIALMAGMEVGLTPTQAMQNVMVVNNRPTIWGDAAIGLVWASEKMEAHDEGIEGTGDTRTAYCTVKRKGDAKPYTVRFSVKDAQTAGLWGKNGPWKTHPDRMLKLKARAFALRDKFADVLKGLGIREEVEDSQPLGAATVHSTESTRELTDKIDAMVIDEAPATEPEKPTKPVGKGDASAQPPPDFDLVGNLKG